MEEQQESKIIVHLTVLDESASEGSVASDIEILMAKGGCIAELKAILESQDLLPSESEDEPFSVEIRLALTSALLQDQDTLAEGTEAVYVTVKHSSHFTSSPDSLLPTSLSPPPPAIYSTSPAFATPASGLPSSLFSSIMNSQPGSDAFQEQLVQNLMNDPQMMRQLMNSPMMRSMISNPEILRSLMEANPQMRELRERNPELNHLLNDPELLRQSMEAMQNPSLMREMISNTDRALSNIDAIPGGFNALRRVYQTIQEPIWNAALRPESQQDKNRVVKNYDLRTDKALSTEAIPNPWGRFHCSEVFHFGHLLLRMPSARLTPTNRPAPPSATISRPSRPQHRPSQFPTGPRLAPAPHPSHDASPLLDSTRVDTSSATPELEPARTSLLPAPVTSSENPVCRNSASSEGVVTGGKESSSEEVRVEELKADEAEPKADSLPSSVEDDAAGGSSTYPYLFQSFFNNPVRLNALGGIGLRNALHISGVRHQASSSSTEQSSASTESPSHEPKTETDEKKMDSSEEQPQ